MDNKVELTGIFGDDTTHALSAWTSTSRTLTSEKVDRVPQLLKFLAENEHETPFEKSYIQFLVTCDTASHIHLLKHRIGVSVNGESARYKELKDDKFYVPDDWPPECQEILQRRMEKAYQDYHGMIEELVMNGLPRKRAKESSRYFLPYANQTTLDISFNFRSFMHFQKLRNDEHAQKEIRDIAQDMLELVRKEHVFDASLAAFGY